MKAECKCGCGKELTGRYTKEWIKGHHRRGIGGFRPLGGCFICGQQNRHKKNKYCSKKCYYISKVGKPNISIYGERNPMKCPEVRKKVGESLKKRWEDGCYGQRVRQSVKNVYKNPRKEKTQYICGNCHNIFERHKSRVRSDIVYCSKDCKFKGMKIRFKGESNPSWSGGSIDVKCIECGKIKKRSQSLAKRIKFCSLVCRGRYYSGIRNHNWLGGKSFEPYPQQFNRRFKKLIRTRDNFTCQECGYTEDRLKHKLDIHHIDYNKKNNNPKNLISLCRQCHNQTNYNREDWINYFNNSSKRDRFEG